MSRKKQIERPITALYCRLSLEDGKDNESMSISNQKAMLSAYAEQHGMPDYAFYVDDGYTGRNFNRPGFQRMINDIEAGKIECVITKDLSRLGRNYIESGSYIEVYFPSHHVRYIAVNDGVDSTEQSREMDITPFKNILNDMYSRDISKKVLSGWMARSRQGKFIGGTPPYGLMRDPEDGGHLIRDPETAPVVRDIFNMALDGMGCFSISRVLLEKKIPITTMRKNQEVDANYYIWGISRIARMLRNPVYYGAHVVCRTHQTGIRSGKAYRVPEDQLEIIENCHEPIVSKEEWDRVQTMINGRPKIFEESSCPYQNIFHGLLYCATCGRSMSVRYEKVGRTDRNRFTGQMREPIDKAHYCCQTYVRSGVKYCTSHKVEARALYDHVLADIRELAALAMADSDAFYQRLTRKMEVRQNSDEAALQAELDSLNARIKEIDNIFMNLYQDKVKGVLSEQRFSMMSAQLDEEQLEARERVQELMTDMSISTTGRRNVKDFIEEIRKYAGVEKLDEAMLHRLIQKITIGERQVVDGEKVQEITIFYNFVGNVTE